MAVYIYSDTKQNWFLYLMAIVSSVKIYKWIWIWSIESLNLAIWIKYVPLKQWLWAKAQEFHSSDSFA